MQFDKQLRVIGGVIVILLSINGWYFKGIENSLKTMALELVKVTTNANHVSTSVGTNTLHIEKLEKRIRLLEIRVK